MHGAHRNPTGHMLPTWLGLRLLGGRLLPGPDGPRAQFMYEDGDGRRVTLYVTVFENNAMAGTRGPPPVVGLRAVRLRG